jgi:putative hydrolase of the HAD superfamily
MTKLTAIGFDADDTLWHNERLFRLTQDSFSRLLADFADPDHLHDRLIAAEKRNIGHYGFGVKGFVLSMIETAIEVTEGRVSASVIAELISAGQDMLGHPIELLPGARDAIAALVGDFRLVLVTKGDLIDQERKLAQSGLGDFFHAVEIVSDKTAETYRKVFARHGNGADRALMVGNSLKSDVLPMLAAGGWGVHVPHDLTWALEDDLAPTNAPKFHMISKIMALPELVFQISS